MKRKSISRGGITYGNSHANGGIKVFNKGTGDMLEVEGGESVINKRSMASPKMVKLNGKDMTICEAASYLNQAEGGVKFNCDDVKHAQFIEEMALGGELERGTRTEREHIQVLNDLYARKITPTQATKKIAKDHIKEDKRYYSKLANMKNKMSSGGEITYPKKMYPTADVIFENGNMIDSNNDATVINNRKMIQVPKITLHREYNDNIQGNMQVRSPQDANDAFRYIFSPSEMAVREFAYILYLDRGNKIVAWESHSIGGIDASVIDIELICTSAVLIAAKGVILAHNHPSGNRQPSDADLKISVRLKKALNILSVSLLDSVILLPNGSYVSLENEGLIDADLKYDDGGNIESLDYDFSEKLGVKVDSLVNPVLRLEHFMSFTNNYCDIDPEVCKNVKSIRRKDMPQIYDDETPQFLTYLRENGITSEFEEDYPVSKITPTQMEISVKRMKNILVRLQNDYYRDDNGEVYNVLDFPVMITNDGYLLDGHHRWAVLYFLSPENTIDVFHIDANIDTVLKLAKTFDGVEYAEFRNGGQAKEGFKVGMVWELNESVGKYSAGDTFLITAVDENGKIQDKVLLSEDEADYLISKGNPVESKGLKFYKTYDKMMFGGRIEKDKPYKFSQPNVRKADFEILPLYREDNPNFAEPDGVQFIISSKSLGGWSSVTVAKSVKEEINKLGYNSDLLRNYTTMTSQWIELMKNGANSQIWNNNTYRDALLYNVVKGKSKAIFIYFNPNIVRGKKMSEDEDLLLAIEKGIVEKLKGGVVPTALSSGKTRQKRQSKSAQNTKPIVRFKTEDELVNQYGAYWRQILAFRDDGAMDYVLGKEIPNDAGNKSIIKILEKAIKNNSNGDIAFSTLTVMSLSQPSSMGNNWKFKYQAFTDKPLPNSTATTTQQAPSGWNWRFKTRQEFEDEFGDDWKDKTIWSSDEAMDYLLGVELPENNFFKSIVEKVIDNQTQSFDAKKHLNLINPYDAGARSWVINKDLIINKPLPNSTTTTQTPTTSSTTSVNKQLSPVLDGFLQRIQKMVTMGTVATNIHYKFYLAINSRIVRYDYPITKDDLRELIFLCYEPEEICDLRTLNILDVLKQDSIDKFKVIQVSEDEIINYDTIGGKNFQILCELIEKGQIEILNCCFKLDDGNSTKITKAPSLMFFDSIDDEHYSLAKMENLVASVSDSKLQVSFLLALDNIPLSFVQFANDSAANIYPPIAFYSELVTVQKKWNFRTQNNFNTLQDSEKDEISFQILKNIQKFGIDVKSSFLFRDETLKYSKSSINTDDLKDYVKQNKGILQDLLDDVIIYRYEQHKTDKFEPNIDDIYTFPTTQATAATAPTVPPKSNVRMLSGSADIANSIKALQVLMDTFDVNEFAVRSEIEKEIQRLRLEQEDISFNSVSLSDWFDFYVERVSQEQRTVFGVACGLDTPSGKPSELDIIQYKTVRTEEFKNWFGDWETAYITKNYNGVSKCINPNTGEPMVMYHGRGNMNFESTSFNLGLNKFPMKYTGQNLSYAKWFANNATPQNAIFEFYVKVINPIDFETLGIENITINEFVSYIEFNYGYKIQTQFRGNPDQPTRLWAIIRSNPDVLRELSQNTNYDGFILYEDNPQDMLPNGQVNETLDFTIFRNEQLKAADGRNTSFLNEIPDVRFEKGGEIKK